MNRIIIFYLSFLPLTRPSCVGVNHLLLREREQQKNVTLKQTSTITFLAVQHIKHIHTETKVCLVHPFIQYSARFVRDKERILFS
jgi:hypothetical protein